MTIIEKLIKDFEKFTTSEINSALEELVKIEKENNRKHLQRLVFVNLINRFDVLIDNLLLHFATDNSSNFSNLVLEKVKDVNVSMKDFYEILLSDKQNEKVNEKVEEIVRSNFLRERHSKKLRILLRDCLLLDNSDLDRPRVNANDGRIHSSYTPRDNKIPPSIIGYADFIYSKRNAVVHGDGKRSSMLKQDSDFIEKNFKTKPLQFISIKLSSIESTVTYYSYICRFIITGKWPDKRGF